MRAESLSERQNDIICIGMALVDSIIKGFDPEPVSASGFRAVSGTLNVGGEAVNEAIAASKLGMKTAILCALGYDTAGEMILQELKKNRVNTELVLRPEGHSTPVTTMFVNDDGTRKSITNQAHRYNFHPEEHLKILSKTRAIILGSMFRAPFDTPEIIYKFVTAAAAAGVMIVADTKLPNFKKISLDDIRESLPYIDYITPNEDESAYFTKKTDPEEAAEVFLGFGVKNVIIKLGGKGCFFMNGETKLRLPALNINAVDATGAGDNFAAGFTAEILNGKSNKEALIFATGCGAVCTTAVGAGTALKSKEQVYRFIEEHS
ncbi:MAG: carbohydrate kinase family protein [Lachnospiraceae bacterium]|nr:carbohydrate kinase family protein [Lachnospiraceae bacterium]